jgi:ABC-type oligopeptide transport system ATPase subunit
MHNSVGVEAGLETDIEADTDTDTEAEVRVNANAHINANEMDNKREAARDNDILNTGAGIDPDNIMLKVDGLSKHFVIKKTPISKKNLIKAVDGVSFQIKTGEAFGVIGESGSGKTTLGELILKLQKSRTGSIIFDGIDITEREESKMGKIRKDMQVIFQYTQEVLDPKMTIEELILEPLKIYKIVDRENRDREVDRLLDMVGLSSLDRLKFPHQMSGGQRQRVGIARAISTRPKFVICDEPISALDVSIQGQILNLLNELKEELGLTYMFISHDLKAVRHFCDRIAVMYKGKIVEIGTSDEIMNNPQNHYTKMLINSQLK